MLRKVRITERNEGLVADSSFDVVSKIDQAELDNAINQTARELDTRFDFKGTGTSITKNATAIVIESETEERAKAALDVFKEKLVKRGVSLKSIDPGEPVLSGKTHKITIQSKEGISQENAKKITKLLEMKVRKASRRRAKVMSFASRVRVETTFKRRSP